jgi:hypothetical protein
MLRRNSVTSSVRQFGRSSLHLASEMRYLVTSRLIPPARPALVSSPGR